MAVPIVFGNEKILRTFPRDMDTKTTYQTKILNSIEPKSKYREVTLPLGTFRMYDDLPFVWHQVYEEGKPSIIEAIEASKLT